MQESKATLTRRAGQRRFDARQFDADAAHLDLPVGATAVHQRALCNRRRRRRRLRRRSRRTALHDAAEGARAEHESRAAPAAAAAAVVPERQRRKTRPRQLRLAQIALRQTCGTMKQLTTLTREWLHEISPAHTLSTDANFTNHAGWGRFKCDQLQSLRSSGWLGSGRGSISV